MARQGMDKDKLLALAQGGAAHRESQKAPPPPPAPPSALPPAPPAPSPVPVAAPTAPKPQLVFTPTSAELPPRVLPPEPFIEDEPPAERPETMSMRPGLPRGRRVGLRSDPGWMQKTFYLRKSTIQAAIETAQAMGVEFSELVDYALAVQVKPETRSADITAIIDARKNRG